MTGFVDVDFDLTSVLREADALGEMANREVPFVIAKTLTRVAKQAKDDERANFESVIDRPTRYTLNSLGIVPAKKTKFESQLFVKDQQAKYLLQPETGGLRTPGSYATGKSFLVQPGERKVNKFGNIPRGSVKRLRAKPNTFTGEIRFKATGKTVAGLWQRPKVGKRKDGTVGTKGRTSKIRKTTGNRGGLKLLVRFADQQQVKPFLKFQKTAEQSARRTFTKEMTQNFADALESTRKRAARKRR